MLDNKPPEFWVALLTGTAFAFRKSEAPSLSWRSVEAGISGGFGYVLAPAAAAWAGQSEAFAVILLSAVGFFVLDIFTSVVADRTYIGSLIRGFLTRIFGGKA